MSKKGVVIASAVAAVVLLTGCIPREPMPVVQPVYQTGPNTKLGPTHHHCKCYHHHHCVRCNHTHM
ncbi:hypothetical protein [Candidatus Coxiella mudrowiae]|uniref:Lipoprotein n=1 Tax=Candidatus Coxiella mudrowiae TaxID=2054173 RepID=A0ABM5UUJ5_9COXI|nr:hypothetical protein [Candidatus Coxiella mudrowiae]AKQ33611.1 hypothetical protein CleRT_08160 [Candidatus Coxiella mudrowiae]